MGDGLLHGEAMNRLIVRDNYSMNNLRWFSMTRIKHNVINFIDFCHIDGMFGGSYAQLEIYSRKYHGDASLTMNMLKSN